MLNIKRFVFFLIFMLSVVPELLAAQGASDDWGFSAELGMNIPHIYTKNRFFELDEEIGSHYSEFKSETTSPSDSKTDVKGRMRQFHVGTSFYYKYFFSQIYYSQNISYDANDGYTESNEKLKTTKVSELDISLGSHWQRRGAMSTFVFMLGMTRLGHEGLNGNIAGSTIFLNATLRFAPMFALTKNFEMGLFLEASGGIPILLNSAKFGGMEYNDIFDERPLPEVSGNIIKGKVALQIYMPRWGVYVQSGTRMRMYEIKASGKRQGQNMTVQFSGNDDAYWYITLGYYYSKPRYNYN